ncbi:glycosyltransferase [Aeromicrobium wangtongii]|uniref:glycosyltransferase n=1 Tax=Aeromicrobium wangtongii TaxID=2969247 RepID=UPI002016B9E4|nr:glycosyltransferase [Aeromicrobium wangtongii]MCL3819633.1 glycosyltransferase [Aeromicrobium wangtongii]
MRVCLIASSRFPVREPYQGGLEAHTATLAAGLIARGHHVSLFAAPGSDPRLNVEELEVDTFEPSAAARQDVGSPPRMWMQEHHAYLRLMLELIATGAERFDVIHNNSLHHLPVAMARALDVPMISSLHTPPLAWLESAMSLAGDEVTFTAVSDHTARAWSHAVDARVIRNGVDTQCWAPGPGGPRAVWTGRLVPEKAPHLAIRAARAAGIDLVLAGARLDPGYFDREVAPLLDRHVEYAGHLSSRELGELVGGSAVAIVSPTWDEPYGLVAAEAMSCGTPVAAFARGAMPEIVAPVGGTLAVPGDVQSLADAVRSAGRLDRGRVRAHAVDRLGIDPMVDGYERVYEQVGGEAA